MTLMENVSKVVVALNSIKNAIIEKGVTPTGDCTTFAQAIAQIPSGSDVKVFDESLTMSANEVRSFECGFKPKLVWFGKNATGSPLISCYYNEDASTTQYLQATGGTMRWLALGSGAPSIDITDTGFVVKNGTSSNNVRVIAVG